jgi:DNA replication protein DnaC
MNRTEIDRTLRQLRLSGMADVLETRLVQAQAESLAPLDFLSLLVHDELVRRQDRLIARRIQAAGFRDRGKTLDRFDFDFNKKLNRTQVYELASARFIERREDALLLGPPGSGKSHLAQAIGHAAILQGHSVRYYEVYRLLEAIADATLDGERKHFLEQLSRIPLLILDDLGMRKLPATAAEDLLEVVMRRYERASTLLTSNRPVDEWGKLLGDTASVSALLDRLLHHATVVRCGPQSYRTRLAGTRTADHSGVESADVGVKGKRATRVASDP